MSSFLLDNYFWKLYPALKWQIPLLYFSSLFLLHSYAFQFTFIFILLFCFYIFPYRIPQRIPYPSHTVQICNTDGTCKNINSDSHNNIYNIFSPVYGTIDRIDSCPDTFVIYVSSMFLDAYALYTPCAGRITSHDGNTVTIQHDKGIVEIKCVGWRINDTLMDDGDLISAGKYIGVANKVEITLSPRRSISLMVREGERLEGFNTVMARFDALKLRR